MGDDGAGAASLALLDCGWELPPGVERHDLGTPGPYLAEYLRGCSAVIVLDTVRAEAPPGEVRVYRGDEVRRRVTTRLSPHSPDLGEALATLALEDAAPPAVVVVGVVPGRVAAGTELTPSVRAALPAMAAAAVAELVALGFEVRPRPRPAELRLWWTAPA